MTPRLTNASEQLLVHADEIEQYGFAIVGDDEDGHVALLHAATVLRRIAYNIGSLKSSSPPKAQQEDKRRELMAALVRVTEIVNLREITRIDTWELAAARVHFYIEKERTTSFAWFEIAPQMLAEFQERAGIGADASGAEVVGKSGS